MPTKLTAAERQEVNRTGAAVLPLKNLAVQPKATYYNQYGDALLLPADPWSQEHYLGRGLKLTPPKKPKQRDPAQMVGVAEWDGNKTAIPSEGPTATYYTADGTSLPNLPADPESMTKYLAAGLTLSPPKPVSISERRLA